jgi:hypothetical protein
MLAAVASNNGINISTGSREPSQQTGPPDPASERFTFRALCTHTKKSFRRLHKVCLPPMDFFLNDSFDYKIPQVLGPTKEISQLNTDMENDQFLDIRMFVLSNDSRIF